MKIPKNAKVEVELETGRKVYLREPKMSDQRIASRIASQDGSFSALAYIEEMIKLLILALYRKNGEEVDITNRDKMMDDILTYAEVQQLMKKAAELGISLEKKDPVIRYL